MAADHRHGILPRCANRSWRSSPSVSDTFLVTLTLLPWRFTDTLFLTVTVFTGLHTFVIAAKAENLPVGRTNSNVLKGWSGTVLKVLLVIPAFEMDPWACRPRVAAAPVWTPEAAQWDPSRASEHPLRYAAP